MNKTKKVLSVVLALCLLLGIVPLSILPVSALKLFGLPVDNLDAKITCGINGYSDHNGFDLGVSVNTPLYAMFSGKAVYYQRYDTSNGKSVSYGNYVVVTSTDGTYKAYYCHLNSFNGFELNDSVISCQNYPSKWTETKTKKELTIGSKDVSVGDLLGYSGSTGNSKGPHCHIGIQVNNVWKDPAKYITFDYSAHSGIVQGEKPYGQAYEDTVKSLSLASYISDTARRQYAEARMKQWLLSGIGEYRVFRQLSQPSNTGNQRSVVFFFEGCSDGVYSSTLSNRMAASCVVVRMENGVLKVVYYNGNSTTLPDFPREYTSDKNGTATIKDGIYTIKTKNHKSSYAALKIIVSEVKNAAVRGNGRECFEANDAEGIHIHAKYFYPVGVAGDDRNSAGCFNVGSLGTKYNTTKKSEDRDYSEYNSFIEAVTGHKSAKNSTYTEDLDMGVVIVDRSQYKNELKTIFNDDFAVKRITAYTDNLPAIGVDSDITVPEVIKNPAPEVYAENAETGTCSYDTGKPVNIEWDPIENAKSYTINVKALNGDPMFLFDATDSEAGTTVSLTKISDTQYQIPASYATAGKSIKIAVAANYEDGTSKWSTRYIRIVPDAPSLTAFADEATVPAGDGLTVTWSGATGAQEYEYKVIELENKKPDRASESEPARRTIIPLSRTSAESFTINGEDLPSGRTFKIWLSSVGKDNTFKGQSYYFYTNGTETNVSATGIAFADSAVSMTIGDTVMKRPTFTPKNSTNKSVQYTSSNTDVATVDADGIVTALAAGSTTITATAYDGGFTASYTVTVGAKATADVWYKQYNPNNNKKITPALIQQFLENHSGSLNSYTTVNGQTKLVTPDGNLDLGFDTYYSYENTLNTSAIKTKASGQTLSPAELIYYACVENDCNVAFILAKLQTEQSLIGQQATREKLACASGYLKTDHTHYQPGEKFYGFVGQLIGLTHQMYLNAHKSDLLTIENCYQNYTQDKNWPFARFENEVYSKYRAEWDTLLGETTVVSENTLDTSNQFAMITPSQEKQIIPAGSLTLEWTDCENADYYMVSMRDVTDGENDSADKQILNRQRVDDPDNQYMIAASYFKNGGTYKIAVGAYMNSVIHDKGYEKWITPYTYVTVSDSASLGRPAFVSPINNTQIAENTPVTVHWSAANGADFYNINMRDLTTDTKIIDARDVGDATSYTIPVSENGSNLLVSGHRYRVAVEAKNYSGDSRWADPHLQFSVAGEAEENETIPESPASDFKYYLTDNDTHVVINGYLGEGGDIRIPSVIDGKSVTAIDNYAFDGVGSLTGVIIPGVIATIGRWAFRNCTSLTAVTLETGVKNVGQSAFYSCISLMEITLPDTVTAVGDYAFYKCTSLTSLTLSRKLPSLGDSAFGACTSLTGITIPNTMTSIGSHAFSNCSSLCDISFEEGSKLVRIDNDAFSGCSGLSSISIPKSVQNIDEEAFSGCASLSFVTFATDSQLLSIGNYAFSGCAALSTMTIPKKVLRIGDNAFRNCESLSSVSFESYSNLGTIGSTAFYGCQSLTQITLPRSVTTLNGYAFENCTSLVTVKFENESKLTRISDGVFQGCSSLQNITIPPNVTNIGQNAFKDCTALATITISGKVTNIQDYAFYNCQTLREIHLPLSVVRFGSHAFYNCNKLKDVYYAGSESDKAKINFGSGNNYIQNATWHYSEAPDVVAVTGITVSPTSTTLEIGGTLQLTAVVLPENATNQKVTWSTSDSRLATVNTAGFVIAIGAGTARITATTEDGGFTATCTITIHAAALSSIEVTKDPTKTTYYVGDTLDTTGMVVTANYSDDSHKTVTGWTCSPTKLNAEGTQTITVSYTEGDVTKTTTFNVTVNSIPVELKSIDVTKTPTKTTYYVGDTLNTVGMEVTAMYSDNSSKTVTGWTCSPTKLNTKGTQTITVSYTEGGVTKTTTFNVTVNEKEPEPEVTLTAIVVTKKPTKTVYDIGEELDTAGIVITATYSDGSTKTISASGCTFTGFDSGSAGTKTVTVTYQRKTDQFTVSVKQADPTSDGLIYIDPAKGYIGQKVDVTIRLQNNPGLVAARLAIGYDASVLKLVDAKNGEVITGGSFITSQTLTTNPYVAMWNDSTATADYTADGVLLTLTFEVLETAVEGNTEITATYEPSATFNYALQDQTLVMHNGSIEITQRVSGDADGDGTLTLKDVVIMRRMLAGWEGYSINDANADVDGDGKVTLKDAVLIERYLANWDVTLK